MQRFLNNYETTLALAINDTVNAIHVYPSTVFDDVSTLTGGDYYLLTISDGTNIEIVKVTNVSVGPIHILTVERDVSASAHGAFAFAAGSSVKMSVVAETLDALNEQLMNADYPPNYTVNVQTRSTAGTVAVPFSPLVIQQVNIDVASGVTLNVTPGATWGECIITLYRTNLSYAWPDLTYNGNVVPIAGEPPGSGNYNAKLLCRSEPGAGYLPNPFVTFEWVTRAVNGSSSSGYLGPFGATNLDHGLVYSGSMLVINPLTQGYLHSASFQSTTTLNITAAGGSFTSVREVLIAVEKASGWPAILLQGYPVTPSGATPDAQSTVLLRVIMVPGGEWYAEWLTYFSAPGGPAPSLALPFTTERVSEPGLVPSYGTGFTSTLTTNYGGTINSCPTSRIARFVAASSIDFVSTGISDSSNSAWSGVRELFIIISGNSTHIPTVKHNNVTITPAGSPPPIAASFPAWGNPPAGMLKVTIMIYSGYKGIKAEWIVFQQYG